MAVNQARLKEAIYTALKTAIQETFVVGDGHVKSDLQEALNKVFFTFDGQRYGGVLTQEWLQFAADLMTSMINEFCNHSHWDTFADRLATAIVTEFQNAEINASSGTVIAQGTANQPVVQLPPGSVK